MAVCIPRVPTKCPILCPHCRKRITDETHKIGEKTRCYTDPWITAEELTPEELSDCLKLLDETFFPVLALSAKGDKYRRTFLVGDSPDFVVTWSTETPTMAVMYQAEFVGKPMRKAEVVTAFIVLKTGRDVCFSSYSEMILTIATKLIRIIRDDIADSIVGPVVVGDGSARIGIRDTMKRYSDFPITIAAFSGFFTDSDKTICGIRDLSVVIDRSVRISAPGEPEFCSFSELTDVITWFHKK